MQSSAEIQTIVQVAIMYYSEHKNQQEIAEIMGLTRQTVSKLLKKAEEKGVVEFRIHNPLDSMGDLSIQIKNKYRIPQVKVIPCSVQSSSLITSILGQSAGKYIVELVESGISRIGLSWGRTVFHAVNNMPSSYCEGAVFFPLVGASNQTAEYFMINEIVRRAADALNAMPAYAFIPADPGSKEDAALFKRTSTYQAIESYWSQIELAVVGIGTNPRLESDMRMSYPGERISVSGEDSVAGDILTHYFTPSGDFIENDENEILCASVENLRKAKRVLAVAGGRNKVAAIHAALKTGIITDLITDQQTCHRLLRMK